MRSKRFLKKLLLVVSICLVALLGLLVYEWVQISRHPAFYRTYEWDDQRRGALAKSAADKLLQIQNVGSDAAQREYDRKHGRLLPATAAVEPVSQMFEEEELNALFVQWIGGNKAKWEQYVQDPGVFMYDGHIVLAGKYKPLGSILSLHFKPTIDKDGKLLLDMDRIMLGKVPVPRWTVDSKLQKAVDSLKARLPAWQQNAKIENGIANGNAAAAGMGKLLLNSMAGRPSEPVLFVPAGSSNHLVVKLTQIKVKDKAMHICVEPVEPNNNGKLLAYVKDSGGVKQ